MAKSPVGHFCSIYTRRKAKRKLSRRIIYLTSAVSLQQTTADVMSLSVRYWGCADRWRWRGLDTGYTGCRYQDYLGWDGKQTLWCLCDFWYCNRVSVTKSNDYKYVLSFGQICQRPSDNVQTESLGLYENCILFF